LLQNRSPHPPGDRRRLAPIVRSVNLAWRVRKHLGLGHRHEIADAIFHPSGRALHATGAAAHRPSLRALRAAVLAREAARAGAGEAVAGAAFWSDLVEGRWSLVDDHEERGQRYILAIRNDDAFASGLALTPHEAGAIDLAIRGRSAKECMGELGVSLSAIYGLRASAVNKLRAGSLADLIALGRRLSDSPLTLAQLGDQALVALRMPAAVGRLSCLTDAEREVGADLLRGLPQREIARRRARSSRTIANQVASIYRKLGVDGRTEFVAYARGVGTRGRDKRRSGRRDVSSARPRDEGRSGRAGKPQ